MPESKIQNPSETIEWGDAETPLDSPQLYWVAIYQTDLSYGGHEEGGWYYHTGILVTDTEVYKRIKMLPTCFDDLETARAYRVCMEEAIQTHNLNEGKHDPSSILSEGEWYKAEIHEGVLPPYYPARKPRYE